MPPKFIKGVRVYPFTWNIDRSRWLRGEGQGAPMIRGSDGRKGIVGLICEYVCGVYGETDWLNRMVADRTSLNAVTMKNTPELVRFGLFAMGLLRFRDHGWGGSDDIVESELVGKIAAIEQSTTMSDEQREKKLKRLMDRQNAGLVFGEGFRNCVERRFCMN